MGVIARMMLGLPKAAADPSVVRIVATYLNAHSTASSLRVKKRGRDRLKARPKGGLIMKLHTLRDGDGKPMRFFLTAGHASEYISAAALLAFLPKDNSSLGGRWL